MSPILLYPYYILLNKYSYTRNPILLFYLANTLIFLNQFSYIIKQIIILSNQYCYIIKPIILYYQSNTLILLNKYFYIIKPILLYQYTNTLIFLYEFSFSTKIWLLNLKILQILVTSNCADQNGLANPKCSIPTSSTITRNSCFQPRWSVAGISRRNGVWFDESLREIGVALEGDWRRGPRRALPGSTWTGPHVSRVPGFQCLKGNSCGWQASKAPPFSLLDRVPSVPSGHYHPYSPQGPK